MFSGFGVDRWTCGGFFVLIAAVLTVGGGSSFAFFSFSTVYFILNLGNLLIKTVGIVRKFRRCFDRMFIAIRNFKKSLNLCNIFLPHNFMFF